MDRVEFNKSELVTLSDELHTIAASLAGINSVIFMVSDYGEINANAANALSLIKGVTEQLNEQVCVIADKMHGLAGA